MQKKSVTIKQGNYIETSTYVFIVENDRGSLLSVLMGIYLYWLEFVLEQETGYILQLGIRRIYH